MRASKKGRRVEKKKKTSNPHLRVRVLQRPVADPRRRLPEADRVVVACRGEDDLAAHRRRLASRETILLFFFRAFALEFRG